MCDEMTLDCRLGCDEPIYSMRDLTAGKVGVCVSSIIIFRVCFSFTNYKLPSEVLKHKNK
jgi:hypothetical protein